MTMLDRLFDTPWLTTEAALRGVLEVATRERLDPGMADALRAAREQRPAAVAMRQGVPLDNTRAVSVRDGVAIVPVTGPIFRYANLLTDLSGATSIQSLARDYQEALDSPLVSAILLAVDSPGGEVTGVAELAQVIYESRSRKPVAAYVDGMAASAGYWIASAAGEIVADPTAALGSIGVVMAVRDPSKTTAREIEIVSSRAPYKRLDPTTQAGRDQYQRMVDAIEAVFLETVARNRGTTPETVAAEYGQGGMLIGREAVAVGLADRLGSFESTLAGLAAGARERRMGGGGSTPRRMFADLMRG